MPNALITGITGQDGSYLAEYLFELGYDVYGLMRRTSSTDYWRIKHLIEADKVTLLEGDMTDQVSLNRAVEKSNPDEVYNLAAQSFVGTSFKQPIYTGEVTALGVVKLLEAVRNQAPNARFYQASTSEMFGEVSESPQNEMTPFHPRSPYGVAKLYGHWATINYREAYDMHASCGLLFNHESPRRGEEFVTRKITLGVARIAEGNQDELRLGNLDAKRDWGDALEYVRAMHTILQHDVPDEFVIGTGQTKTVRECAKIAFDELGLDYKEYVEIDERFYRPAEVNELRADPSKAKRELDWEPETEFEDLIRKMVQVDHERVKRGDIKWIQTKSELRPQSDYPSSKA